jgi:hypothetical protein
MRVKLPKNFNPMQEVFQLTLAEIEAQVMEDLIRYKKVYFSKYKKTAPAVLDVDNFVQELWGISIEFGVIAQPEDGRLILGRLEPENQRIIVDDKARSLPQSISFTIAHEAGHLSLHASMFRIENGLVNTLKQLGLVENRALKKPVDLALHADFFTGRFGLSRQALEIRFAELSIPVINAKYPRFNK